MRSTLFTIVTLVFFCCPASAAPKDKAEPKIRPGEQYRLTIRGIPEEEKAYLDRVYSVDPQGGMNIPYVGRIQVAGMTIEEAEKAIEDMLKKKSLYNSPKIRLEHSEEARLKRQKKKDG